MTEHFATSPFGGRMMNAAHFLSYENLRQHQSKLRQHSTQPEQDSEQIAVSVDRWKLLRALTEARDAYQLSSRSIAVLEALLSFYPDKILDSSAPLIVFPSNHELSMRLRGMSAPTIRRHIATLVEIGFILRRDSPNGKRFVRRDSNGEIAMAFGFDLAPLVLKASEIELQAEKNREENRIRQQLRFTITIHLRDISKTILAAFSENREGEWEALYDQLQALSGRVERNGTLSSLELREHALSILRSKVENLYLSNVSEPKMSGNEAENEHHIQNSNIESFDKIAQSKTQKTQSPNSNSANLNQTQNKSPHLSEVLNQCPQINNYSVHGIQNWKDLVITAGHIRSMLGITVSAWHEACETMGEINAAVTIAAILERSDKIHSAGGYLRKLTQKAENGQYCVQPVLRALSQTKH